MRWAVVRGKILVLALPFEATAQILSDLRHLIQVA